MPALQTLAVANYRSIRSLVLPLEQLNLITGANGSGKSNLYRALRLLAEAAQGGIVSSLAREGGLSSTLWAGPESFSRGMKKGTTPVQGGPRREPVHLRLGFQGEGLGYSIELGLPIPDASAFSQDPQIKLECAWGGPAMRPSALLAERRGPAVRLRNSDGQWDEAVDTLPPFESMLSAIADPRRAPELLALRDEVRAWRFYDHFRADADAPARQTQIGTRTPVLSNDGRDLAAAIQTIREIGDGRALSAAVDDAFPGATVDIAHGDGRFTLLFSQHGLLRPLTAAELSDGTLRYLLWIAALLTPRPPSLMILNEPETSLHPDLLPALARLIELASQRTQVWVVSHAARMIAALRESRRCNAVVLTKDLGETAIEGQGMLDAPPWKWPAR
jgi:predicted ATPase